MENTSLAELSAIKKKFAMNFFLAKTFEKNWKNLLWIFACKKIWKFERIGHIEKVWKNLTMKIFFSKNMNKTRENKIALAQVQIKDANFMLTKLFYLILTLHTFCDYTTLYFHEFITNKYVVLSKFTFRGWAPTGWQNGHLPPWKLGLRTQSI